jgi:pyrrolidone-carboxylate peptidase
MEDYKMKNILITGFEPFGDYAENLSEIAAIKLKKIGDYNVYGLTFPVRIFPVNQKQIISYTVNSKRRFYAEPVNAINYGDEIVAKAKEIDACAIISLGIASDVCGVRIETQAINWVENYKYCLESEQRRVLEESLILKKELRVDLDKWRLGKLWNIGVLINQFHKAGCDCNVSLSSDAGTFCCNALMFRTLLSLQKNNYDIPYLFLHIPCSKGAFRNIPNFDQSKDLMTLEKLEKVLTVIMDHKEN